MNSKKQTGNEYFKLLSIIHIALLAGQIIFLILAYFSKPDADQVVETDITNQILVPLLLLGGVIVGHFIYKKKLVEARGNTSLGSKLEIYRTAHIVKFAFIEGPSIFAIANFMITGDFIFLIFAVLAILYFFALRPTKVKTISELELSIEEKELLNDRNTIIS